MSIYCGICGYLLNGKNYNLNSFGRIRENDENEIINCPFCGVSKEYFVHQIPKGHKDVPSLTAKTQVILDHAMKLEVFNGDFYYKAAELVENKKLSNTFKSLGNIEYVHANIHRKLLELDRLPKLKNIDYSKYNAKELILLARKREEHAIAFYNKYVMLIEEGEIARVLSSLSIVEEEHIEVLDINSI